MIKLSPKIIALIEAEVAAEYPQLHPFLAALHSIGYFTPEQWEVMCRARTDSVINHGIPRHETNLLICLLILEEQGL